MTAEERAYKFMREHEAFNAAVSHAALVKLLKEQDRDTRHACAEAVIECPEASYYSSGVIYKGDAEKACMNAKAA